MRKLKLNSAAKINLGLYVTDKRADGYHELSSIFLPISYYDTIELEEQPKGISIESHPSGIFKENCPLGKDNIVHRAYELISDKLPAGVRVRIEKNIPARAGLGGGSSNCAAFLRGVNKLYKLGLDTDELKRLGLKLGADVPFFIEQKASLVSGIGDVLEHFDIKKDYWVVVVKPPVGLSTADVYKAFSLDLTLKTTNAKHSKFLRSLSFQGLNKAEELKKLSNDLEVIGMGMKPELAAVRQYLEGLSPLVCMMSGSGTAFYALFERYPELDLKGLGNDWFFCTTKVLRGHYANHRN